MASSGLSVLEFFKVVAGFAIAVVLGAMLVTLLIPSRKDTDGAQLRESNEMIGQLQRESNELLARLAREQQVNLEGGRQSQLRTLMSQHWSENRVTEEQYHKFDRLILVDQMRNQLEMNEKFFLFLKDERQSTEQHRREDLSRLNDTLVSDFINEILASAAPWSSAHLQWRVHVLLTRLDPPHKSVLVRFLYQMNFLHANDSTVTHLDLHAANLNDLDLDDDRFRLDYSYLFLPVTNLVNASFQRIQLNRANFSSSYMPGASFRSSDVVGADFRAANVSLGDFRDANVSRSDLSRANLRRASFSNADLSQASLQYADISASNFRDANLAGAQLNGANALATSFYLARAMEANFSQSYMPNCVFQWADLRQASFRWAVLSKANFDTANVQGVDFTRADLTGAWITPGQLENVLSLANAILPDGSIARNRNLVGHAGQLCTGMNSSLPDWNRTGEIFEYRNGSADQCAFQAGTTNATLQRRLNVGRYQPLVDRGLTRVFIEMRAETTVYVNVRFIDERDAEAGPQDSTLNKAQLSEPSTYVASLSCPARTVELEVTVVFGQVNATLSSIYVTIE